MGILFKNRKELLERGQKIVKRQYGGTIPVYASFQVQQAQQAPYNPTALLARYQNTAPQTTTPKSGGGKSERKALDIKGLPNDAAALTDQMMGAEMELEHFLQSGGDMNSASGRYLQSQADAASSLHLNNVAHREKEWNQAQITMKERMSEGMPMFDGSRFLASRIVKDENGRYKEEYKKVTPKQLHQKSEAGGKMWEAVTYGKAHDLLANSMDEMFLWTGDGQNLTTDLSYGMGMTYIENELMDPNYDRIGNTANAWKESQGGNVDQMGNTLKNYMRGESTSTNKGQLDAALAKLRTSMSKPAMDALRGKFWLSSRSEEEVQNKINKYFALHMAQQLKIDVSEDSADIWDPVDPEDLGGGSGSKGAPAVALGTYLQEALGGGQPNWVNQEFSPITNQQATWKAKKNIMTLPTWSAPQTTKLLKANKTLSANTDFGVAGDIENAILPNGERLRDYTVKLWGEDQKLADIAMPSKSGTVKVSQVPIKNGKVYHAAVKDIQNMNKEIKKIQDKRDENSLARPGNDVWLGYEKDIEAIKQKFFSKEENQGVVLKPMYLVDVVFAKEGNKHITSQDISDISSDDVKWYQEKFGTIYDNSSYWQGSDHTITAKKLSKSTILIPINDYADLQQIDKDVYFSKDKAHVGRMFSEEAGRYMDMSENDFYNAIQQVILGQDEGGTNIYNSLAMTQYMNQ